MYHVHVWVPLKEELDRIIGTEVIVRCELLSGFWESNPGPLKKYPVLPRPEPSFQPWTCALTAVSILFCIVHTVVSFKGCFFP